MFSVLWPLCTRFSKAFRHTTCIDGGTLVKSTICNGHTWRKRGWVWERSPLIPGGEHGQSPGRGPEASTLLLSPLNQLSEQISYTKQGLRTVKTNSLVATPRLKCQSHSRGQSGHRLWRRSCGVVNKIANCCW